MGDIKSNACVYFFGRKEVMCVKNRERKKENSA